MTIARAVLQARHVGIRELREHLSKRLKDNRPIVVTEHGTPTKVILSYRDMLELIEILDELQDRKALESVRQGRKAVLGGAPGIPVSRLFQRIRRAR